MGVNPNVLPLPGDRLRGLWGGDCDPDSLGWLVPLLLPLVPLVRFIPYTPNRPRETGVMVPVPGVSTELFLPFVVPLAVVRRSASAEARSSRLVVPSAFVDPERAEHTMATLCWSM